MQAFWVTHRLPHDLTAKQVAQQAAQHAIRCYPTKICCDFATSCHLTPNLLHLQQSQPDPYLAQRWTQALGVSCRLRDDLTASRQVAQQATRCAIGRVHGAQEAPGVGQQLAHGRRAQLREVGTPVHAPEVRYVPACSQP